MKFISLTPRKAILGESRGGESTLKEYKVGFFCLFLRQGLTIKSRLISNWLSCLSLPSAGIIGMNHYVQIFYVLWPTGVFTYNKISDFSSQITQMGSHGTRTPIQSF
jgi:hypothetical protein